MGAKADHDLWGQALAIESRYGDRGPEVIATMIDELQHADNYSSAAFWTSVADCLKELHAIRYPGRIGTPTAEGRRPVLSVGSQDALLPRQANRRQSDQGH
jgi:hypothetical protein